ncbi:MAG: Na(+)/H(+) antiporter subunit D [Nitrospirota bacterium]
MSGWLHPSLFFFSAAGLIPFLHQKARPILLLGMPALAFLSLLIFPEGIYGELSLMDMSLTFGRVDRLSLVFGYIFTLITVIGMIYSLHVKRTTEHVAALLYAGSAIGAVFAGDLITLFLFWEAMAFSSAVLIFLGGNTKAGFRYLLVHLFGGVCLLAGIVLYLADGNEPTFSAFNEIGVAQILILIGFLVNAAVPPIHAWLADAYPEATVTGIVFLSAFTTKTAVYVLIRGFAGFTPLAMLGAVMTLYGVLYAMLENDIRRLLAYHIISQVGFMVAGVGIGTPLAINGAVAHAFAHILYKALLMMGMSSVLFVTGKRKATELGGLYKTMPLVFLLYMVGGLSISGFPLFSGFISKSMTISAAAEAHQVAVYLMMTIASCGTFISTTLKLPYAVFGGSAACRNASLGGGTAPAGGLSPVTGASAAKGSITVGGTATSMPGGCTAAMGIAASLCLLLGIFPGLLYQVLPYPVEYNPFTAEHLVHALQMLGLTGLVFSLALKYLHPHPVINVDTDWFYRKGGALFMRFASGPIAAYEAFVSNSYRQIVIAPMKRFVARCRKFDIFVIDGMVNQVGDEAFRGSRGANRFEKYVVYGFINWIGYMNHIGASIFRRLQTGSVHHYAMILIVGIFLLVNVYLILRKVL